MTASTKPLIIATDDDLFLLEMYAAILRQFFNADVITTSKPSEAVRLAIRKIPDLFITDLVKRRTNGVNLIARLRAHPRTVTVPIWVISGQVNTELGLRAINAGADLMIEKPFATDYLRQQGDRLFNRRRTGRFDHLLDLATETQDVDFKREITTTRDGFAAVAKDIIAIANFGGGYLVFGFEEKTRGSFSPVGLGSAQLKILEVTSFNSAVREFVDPPHAVKCHRVQRDGLAFVVLEIPGTHGNLLLAKKQNDTARLYPGRIYSRSTACESAEVRDNHELRRLLERIISTRTRKQK